MENISVLIADDHKLLRESLSYIINMVPGFKVIASCEDSEEAIEITKAERPDIVLMDINMKPFSGIEATQKIKASASSSIVIGMSAHADPAYAKKMLKMGARGYVTKNSPKDEIFNAINKVRQGEIYVCQEIKDIMCKNLIDPNPVQRLESLTEREKEIIVLIKKGNSSKEIATDLNVSVKTVEVHRHNILKKLKLKNSAALVNFVHNNAGYLV